MEQGSDTDSGSGIDTPLGSDIETITSSPFLSPVVLFKTKEGTTFPVHEDIIARACQHITRRTVHTSMYGGMTKSPEGAIALPETSAATFALFLEFAYFGTYDIPGQEMQILAAEDSDVGGFIVSGLGEKAPDIPDNSESIAYIVLQLRRQNSWSPLENQQGLGLNRKPENTEKWMQYRFAMAHPSQKTPSQRRSCFTQDYPACTWEDPESGCYFCLSLRDQMISCKPVLRDQLTFTLMVDSYYDLLMPHIKAWIFGDIYGVPKLCDLSLARLHQLLKYQERPTDEDQVDDLVSVVRYLFEHTEDGDILRTLFVDYAAAIAKGCGLLEHASFRELMLLPAFSTAYTDTCLPIMHGTNIIKDD